MIDTFPVAAPVWPSPPPVIYEFDDIKAKLESSDAWVARAIYRLNSDFDSISTINAPAELADDKIFFNQLSTFFGLHGFFTDRHIALARKKIRAHYIMFLVHLSLI
jgi:hypothetical protein